MKGESEMGMYEHYRSIQTLIPEASHFSKSEQLEFPVERETVQRHCATVWRIGSSGALHVDCMDDGIGTLTHKVSLSGVHITSSIWFSREHLEIGLVLTLHIVWHIK